jgi:hypothetical protein
MSKQHETVGTAVLDILVERHQRLLEERGEIRTKPDAVGKLLACYLRFDRERILAAVRSALEEVETERAFTEAIYSPNGDGTLARDD